MRDARLTDLERRIEAACRRRAYTRTHLQLALSRYKLQPSISNAVAAVRGIEAATRQGAQAFKAFAARVAAIGREFERGERW
jgi:hypothetical protein